MEKKRILVLDDDRRVLNFVGISLRMANYEVVTALSAEQALAIARMHVPDLVLIDFLMPGMDGLEVLRKLREFSDVPAIIFSIDDSVIHEALELGAADFILKPVQPGDLIERINRVLNPPEE